jgi:5-methylcytosine-specific restriction endonuclease McrA
MRWPDAKRLFLAEGRWEGVNHPIVIARRYRRFLLETRINSCAICGTQTWMGQAVPLVMDHIDGNAENWDLENLRLICGNCDMQLPTHKNKNRGKGRGYRRTRYSEGKTY